MIVAIFRVPLSISQVNLWYRARSASQKLATIVSRQVNPAPPCGPLGKHQNPQTASGILPVVVNDRAGRAFALAL
jgi:hypothetical protein